MSKMTPREALDKALKELCGIDYHEVKEALLPLVEKSEPKMVVGVRINDGASTVCPVCATFIHYGERHCSGCGQALKWEEK